MKMNYKMEELLPIVQKLTERYTSKASSSITYERAQQLMGAALYCMEEAWGRNGNGENGADTWELAEEKPFSSAEEAYEAGYHRLVQKVETAQKQYNERIGSFRSYGNRAYYDTVVKGMPGFFLRYDPRFCPQDTILTLDYPILESLEDLRGADRVCRYLECIWLEQRFLNQFPEEMIRKILAANNQGYKELLINLCSEVLKKLLCCALLEVRPGAGNFSNKEYIRLEEIIKSTDRISMEGLLEAKLVLLTAALPSSDERMEGYLEKAIPDLASELVNGALHGCLQNIM